MSEQDGRAEVWEELRKLTRAHNQCVRILQAEIVELREQLQETARELDEMRQALAVTSAA